MQCSYHTAPGLGYCGPPRYSASHPRFLARSAGRTRSASRRHIHAFEIRGAALQHIQKLSAFSCVEPHGHLLLNSGDRMVCASEQVVRACGEFDLAHSAVVRMSRPRDQVRPLQAREQIVTATEDVMAHRPGFRLGNIHASLDGARRNRTANSARKIMQTRVSIRLRSRLTSRET